MKKIFKNFNLTITIMLIIIFISFGTLFSIILYKKNNELKHDYTDLFGCSNKVVLFIGDGMGDNHIKTASTYLEREIFFTDFGISGHCITSSNSLLSPTDSAAAASALATGQKYDNGEISRHDNKDITSISELAISKGFGVGIVTTDSLNGATPSGFSAHTNSRSNEDEIINDQMTSNIKLFLGAGKSTYEPYKDSIINNGYDYFDDYSQLDLNSSKIFAPFERVPSNSGTNSTPTLQMLTNFAIEYMEKNCPKGYFLMIEGAHIDKRSHDNNILSMVRYLDNFDSSIQTAYNLIGSKKGTAIIVTADHETGNLKYNGETKSEINNSMYTSTGHSSSNVPYYIHLTANKKIEPSKIFASVIDNTDIFRICKNCLDV